MANPSCSKCGGTGIFFALPPNRDPKSLIDATVAYDCPCTHKEKQDVWAKRIGFGLEYTEANQLWCEALLSEDLFNKNLLIDASRTRQLPITFYSMVYGTAKYFWKNPLVKPNGRKKPRPDIMFIPHVDMLLRYLLTDEPDLDSRIFNCDVLIIQLIAAKTDKVNHRLRMLFDTKLSGYQGVIWFVRVTTSDFEETCNPETRAMFDSCCKSISVDYLLSKMGHAPVDELPPPDTSRVALPPPAPQQRLTKSTVSTTFSPTKDPAPTPPPDPIDTIEEADDSPIRSLKGMNTHQYRGKGKGKR